MVQSVCADLEASALKEREKAMLRYVAKVNEAPAAISQGDVDRVKEAGWPESAIFDALTVCAIFNFFNRWIDGSGVTDVPKGFYEGRLRESGEMGYSMG